MWWSLWLVAAGAGPTINLAVDAGVEVPLNGEGVGFRLGGGVPFLLGDACDYLETDCRSARGWAIAGPRAALRWSRRDAGTVELGGNLGYMHADVAHIGWIPLWQAEARAHAELGLDGVSLAVGGLGSRSLSWRRNVSSTGYTTGGGFEPLAVQLGALARPLGTERAPTVLAGLGVHLVASYVE
jgi:hypothetical protein